LSFSKLPAPKKDAFQLFVEATRPEIELKHPKMSVSDRGDEVGRIWTALSLEKKAEWQKKADDTTKTN